MTALDPYQPPSATTDPIPGPPGRLVYVPADRDLARALVRTWSREPIFRVLFLVLAASLVFAAPELLGASGFWFEHVLEGPASKRASWALVMLLSVVPMRHAAWALTAELLRIRWARGHAEPASGSERILEVTPRGLAYRDPWCEELTYWHSVRSVVTTAGALSIRLRGGEHVVPRASVVEGDLDRFATELTRARTAAEPRPLPNA